MIKKLARGSYLQKTGVCVKCSKKRETEVHHVVYSGNPQLVVELCIKCHEHITNLNTEVAELRGYVPLTDVERYFIFNWWVGRKLMKKVTRQDIRLLMNDINCV